MSLLLPLHFSVEITENPDPLKPGARLRVDIEREFLSSLKELGACRQGARTITVEEDDPETLTEVLRALDARMLYAQRHEDQIKKHGFHSLDRKRSLTRLHKTLVKTEAGKEIGWKGISQLIWEGVGERAEHPKSGVMASQAIVVSKSSKYIYFKLCTTRKLPKAFNLWRVDARRRAYPILAAEAAEFCRQMESHGHEVYRSNQLYKLTENSLLVKSAGAQGYKVFIDASSGLDYRSGLYQLEDLKELIEEAKEAGVKILTRAGTLDLLNMQGAKAYFKEGLYKYQAEAVGLHLATEIGYLNACAPGLGKTPMTLTAFEKKAEAKPNYRALVVCPAAVRTQWKREANKFFPKAKAQVIEAANLKAELEAISQGTGPQVIIMSYTTLAMHIDTVKAYRFNDLALDEAAILRNPNSLRSKALWELRNSVDCAVALTGTPIDKELKDLSRILGWVRRDSELSLEEYRIDSVDGLKKLWKTLGPMIYRRDRSEIADELPSIQTQVVSLDPTSEELKLAEGARHQLEEIRAEIEIKLEKMANLSPKDKKLQELKDEVKTLRGARLAGVVMARMASSDPQAVMNSDSSSAKVLKEKGLVTPAVTKGRTKWDYVLDTVKKQVANGERILVFTDFATIAEELASSFNQAGVKAGVYQGSMNDRERDHTLKAFSGTPCKEHIKLPHASEGCPECEASTLEVLVLTKSAKEGLNLQRASVVVHYDLPWTPSEVIQRVGRAVRFGSSHKSVQVIIPVMTGTVEERIAALLVPRAVTAMKVLDATRGADSGETEAGLSLAGLDKVIPDSEKWGDKSMFDLAVEPLENLAKTA